MLAFGAGNALCACKAPDESAAHGAFTETDAPHALNALYSLHAPGASDAMHSPHALEALEAALSRSTLPASAAPGVPNACGACLTKKTRRRTLTAPCHPLALSGRLRTLSAIAFVCNIAPGAGAVSEASANGCPPMPGESAGKADFIGSSR